jgi:hypothetical protein
LKLLLLKRQHVAEGVLNMIKLELTVEEVNGILSSLGKMPYELSHAIIDKVRAQALAQINPETEAK